MKNPLVYVLILNWNGLSDTLACIESVRKSDYPNLRVLLVDNGSRESPEAEVMRRFPDIEYLQTKENLGFAGGNNVGFAYALKKKADYVFILNNDTEIAKDAISQLVRFCEKKPKAGAAGSKIYYHSHPNRIWSAGSLLVLGKSILRGINEEDWGQYDVAMRMPQVVGAAILMRASALRQVGGFDEGYFAYYEETKWCLLAGNAGWQIWYVPASKVWHKVAASTGGGSSPQSVYYLVRNRLHLIVDVLPWVEKLPAFLLWVAEVCVRAASYCARGKFALVKATLKGGLHGLCGRTGK